MFVKYNQASINPQIGIITIDRAEALNALNAEVLEELGIILKKIDINITRCVIITGAGDKSFVAGADIGAMQPLTQAQAKNWCLKGNAVMRLIETLDIPVIAAVNGFALGGGCELALACDIRLASQNAAFGQPEVTLGITAGFGGTVRLPRLVGEGMAKELLYTAKRIKADEALRIGLVNAVYTQEELMDKALEMAGRIAKNAPIAVQQTKKSITIGVDDTVDEAIKVESEAFSACFETQDQQEGMNAFLEKRKATPFVNK